MQCHTAYENTLNLQIIHIFMFVSTSDWSAYGLVILKITIGKSVAAFDTLDSWTNILKNLIKFNLRRGVAHRDTGRFPGGPPKNCSLWAPKQAIVVILLSQDQ